MTLMKLKGVTKSRWMVVTEVEGADEGLLLAG